MRRRASAMVTFVIVASLISAIGVAYFLALQHISAIRPTAWDAALRIHNAVEHLQRPPQSMGKSITVQVFIPEGSTLSIVKKDNGFTVIVKGAYGDLSYRFTDPVGIFADNPITLEGNILALSYKTINIVAGNTNTAEGNNIITLGPGRHVLVFSLVNLDTIRVDEISGGFGIEIYN